MVAIRASTLLLVSLALVCKACAAGPPTNDRAERAVAEIKKVGGNVVYDSSRPARPVIIVVFRYSRVDDSVLSHLRAFPRFASSKLSTLRSLTSVSQN